MVFKGSKLYKNVFVMKINPYFLINRFVWTVICVAEAVMTLTFLVSGAETGQIYKLLGGQARAVIWRVNYIYRVAML